jgi:hypothetical protein
MTVDERVDLGIITRPYHGELRPIDRDLMVARAFPSQHSEMAGGTIPLYVLSRMPGLDPPGHT